MARGRRSIFYISALAGAAVVLGGSGIVHAVCPVGTSVWVGTTTSWNTASNWSPVGIPGSGTDVCINVNIAFKIDANVDVKSIIVQDAYTATNTLTAGVTLRVRGNLTVSSSATFKAPTGGTTIDGTVSLTAGTFNGNGATVHILGSVTVSGGTFTNTGVDTIDGSVSVSSGDFNGGAGTVTVTGDVTASSTGGFKASSTTTTISGGLNISGSGAVTDNGTTGTIHVVGAVTQSGGTFLPNAASTVTTIDGGFSKSAGTFTGGGGTLTITGNLALSGTGNFTASSGTTTVSGNLTMATTGTFSGNGGATTVSGNVTQSNGTFSWGAGSIRAVNVDVSAGSFNGGAGTITITGTLTLSSAGNFQASSTTTSISGSVNVTTSGTFTGNGATTIGGSVTQSSGTFTWSTGSVQVGTVMVPGSVSVSGGSFNGGSAAILITGNLTVSSTGSFRACSTTTTTVNGTLNISGSGAVTDNGSGGTIHVLGAVTMSGGTFVPNGGTTVTTIDGGFTNSAGTFTGGGGALTITGNLALSGTGIFTASSLTTTINGNLNMTTSGTFTGNGGATTVSGDVTQSNGTYTAGSGSLRAVNVSVSAGSFNGGAGTITATGDVTLSGTGNFQASSTTTTVSGNVNVTTSGTFTGNGGAATVAGSLSQSAGTYTAGSGSLQVLNMTVSGGTFTGGGGAITATGNLAVSSAGSMRVSSSTTTVNGDLNLSGSGAVTGFSNGAVHVLGNVNLPSGSFSTSGTATSVQVDLGFIQSGGTFAGGSGAIQITGNLTESGGAFTGGGGTINVTGNLTVSSGTVTGGNGAIQVGAIMVPGNLSVSGGSFTGAAGAITVTGDLALSSTGNLTAASSTTTVYGNLTISGSAAVTGNGGTIHVLGSLSPSGGTFSTSGTGTIVQIDTNLTLSGGAYTGGSGTITVNGNVTQSAGTFTASNGAITITGNLIESGGTFTASATGSTTTQISGYLSVTSGTFAGGAGTVKVTGDLGPLSGGTFQASTRTVQVGGSLNRTSASNTFDGNTGTIMFTATSGTKTHTSNGAVLCDVIFNDGLVGYWNLDAVVSDSSGYRNNGTQVGTATWTGAAGVPSSIKFSDTNALTFDGSTNYVTLGVSNLPAANAAQTISLWAKFASAATTQSMVALTDTGSAIKLGLGGGNVRVGKSSGADLAAVAAPSVNVWHQIVYTFDGTTDKLYVDGVLTNGLGVAHDTATPTAAVLGATSGPTELFNGSLDDVRVYTRALTFTEVSALALGRMPATGITTHTFAGAFTTHTAVSGSGTGDFIIASGIVAGSTAISVGANWTNYGGRFTNTSTVTLTSDLARSILSGGQSFSNLTISGAGAYTLGDRLWIPGGTVTIGANAALNPGAYVAHIGYLVDQTAANNGWQAGTGTAVLDGSADQTLLSKNFYGLRIEDPSESNLVAYWKLDEGEGSSLRDVSGNADTGAVSATGATWTSASTTIGFDNAAAMSFDGSAGNASMGTTGLPAANAAQTISLWTKFSSSAATQAMVALTATGSAIEVGLGGGNVRVWKSGGTDLAHVAAPSTGAWHHIAYTFDGTTDTLYVDGVATAGLAVAHNSSTPTAAFIGATSAAAEFFSGQLDDVRVYNAALTAAQVAQLAAGRYAGRGGLATVTLGVNLAIPINDWGLMIDSGNLFSSTFKATVSVTTAAVQVNSGTLHIGSDVVNFDGGLTINPMGTLLMDTSGGQFQPGSGTTLTIDGTLVASSAGAIIARDNSSQVYTFKVGTFSGSTPTLNITGLAVRDTDAHGMWINADQNATTTFTRFDNITFRRGTTTYLNIFAKSLYLTSDGCVFGVGDNGGSVPLPTNNITLAGNGTADGETRAVFGRATCHANQTTGGYCKTSWKVDDDADNNGVGDTPASNGAVVQYVRGAESDTAGSIAGFPSAALDWNTFTYYSTYAAFNAASGTSSVVYVRDQAGIAKYSWPRVLADTAGETIVGTPRWNTVGSTHYLYVAMASGKIYRLVDNLTSLTLDVAWSPNPFDCGCTIVTPLGMDTNNLYWGGTTAGPVQKLWTLSQSAETQPMGSPLTVTPTITSASPALWTNAGTTYLFLGLAGHLLEINASNQTLAADNTNPGAASVWGRIGFGTNSGSNRIFAGDDGGTFWAIDPTNFAGTNKVWSYAVASDQIKSSSYYDYSSNTVHFGTEGGKVVALNSSGAALTGYPYTPGSASDSIRSALLYQSGVLLVGSTTGKLFIIDRNTGSGPALIREYYFGPTENVSGIAYDANASRYMVSTSDPTTKDGRLYYIDVVADPTGGSS